MLCSAKDQVTLDPIGQAVIVSMWTGVTNGALTAKHLNAWCTSGNLANDLQTVQEGDRCETWPTDVTAVVCLLQDCDALWEDFHNKLVDSTLLNLDAYLQNFPDLKVTYHLAGKCLMFVDVV